MNKSLQYNSNLSLADFNSLLLILNPPADFKTTGLSARAFGLKNHLGESGKDFKNLGFRF